MNDDKRMELAELIAYLEGTAKHPVYTTIVTRRVISFLREYQELDAKLDGKWDVAKKLRGEG